MTEPNRDLPIMGSTMEPVLISFHAPVHDLDLVAQHVVRDGLPAHLRDWQRRSGAREIVYLATCQRVLWMVWEGEAGAIDPGPGVRRYEGEEAWAHLLAMSAGLESANLGDREIPGQLKDALVQARQVGVAGDEAQTAIEDVIREGQRLRARLGLADGNVSVATVALKSAGGEHIVVRFTAEARGSSDVDRRNRMLSTVMAVYLGLALLAALIVAGISPFYAALPERWRALAQVGDFMFILAPKGP